MYQNQYLGRVMDHLPFPMDRPNITNSSANKSIRINMAGLDPLFSPLDPPMHNELISQLQAETSVSESIFGEGDGPLALPYGST